MPIFSAEAATQDCNEKLKHYQEQVNRVRTQREYSAILAEIDLVREQSKSFEEQALTARSRQRSGPDRVQRVGAIISSTTLVVGGP